MPKGRDWEQLSVVNTGGQAPNEKVKQTTAPLREGSGRRKSVNHKEDSMLDAIDLRRDLAKLVPIFEKLDTGAYDIGQALSSLSGPALKQLTMLAFAGESEKTVLEATKHVLGLAGFTPVQKHAVASFDANTSKEQLLSIIAGSKKDLEDEGIEIVDDREDQAK
jgi:hypothetical protein